MSALSLTLRSIAAHERDHKGHVELAGIIDAAAAEIERLLAARLPDREGCANRLRAHFRKGCVVSSDGVERVYYNGWPLYEIIDIILEQRVNR